MRSATRLTREAIARRLATTPGTIEDLENGALSSLPHWRETVRIVRGYCELLRLDPQPILWRMQSQWESSHDDPPTRSNGTRPPGPPPAALRKEAGKSRPPARVRRRARTMFALSAPLALAAGAFYVAQAAPAPIYRAIALLPQAVAGTAPARAWTTSCSIRHRGATGSNGSMSAIPSCAKSTNCRQAADSVRR